MKGIGLRGVAGYPEEKGVHTTVVLIQSLIPLRLQAAGDALAAEVTRLAGPRYARTGGLPGVVRWSQQGGSIYLLDQKLPITYQGDRDLPWNEEVALSTYQQRQTPRLADAGLFPKVLIGLSCRNYEARAGAVPAAFELSAPSISRRHIRPSEKQLQALQAELRGQKRMAGSQAA